MEINGNEIALRALSHFSLSFVFYLFCFVLALKDFQIAFDNARKHCIVFFIKTSEKIALFFL